MQYAKRYDAVSTLAGYKFNIFLLQALTYVDNSENLLILPYHAMSIKMIRSVRVHLVWQKGVQRSSIFTSVLWSCTYKRKGKRADLNISFEVSKVLLRTSFLYT